MVIHCHFTVSDIFTLYTEMFYFLCHSINPIQYQSVLTSNLCHLFLYESDNKLQKTFAILLTEPEPYILMFCSHWIGNDLVFSSNPRKGENRHCWVCPVPWDSRTVVALSVLTIASYLHTGKLLRYFLRWLVLMLGFLWIKTKVFRPACFAYYPWLFLYLAFCFWFHDLFLN